MGGECGPRPGARGVPGNPGGFLRGPSRGISLFPWARGLPVPGRMRPPFSPPGREPSRGASLAPSGQFTSCVAPGGREAPGEPFRWGSPGPLRDDTKRGDRGSPLFGIFPLRDGSRQPPSHGRRPCPPFLRKGGIPRKYLTSDRRVPIYPQQPGCGSKKRRTGHPGGTPTSATAIRG